MKKSLTVVFISCFVVMSLAFSSAGWFSDIFGKTTGNVVSDSTSEFVPLYRLWNSNSGDYFYTTKESEKTKAIGLGYVDEGSLGYVFTNQVSGTVPLYRFWSSSMEDHFYTTKESEKTKVMGLGFAYEGIVGYVYSASGSDRDAIYRFWNSQLSNHFYTTSSSEKLKLEQPEYITAGWVYEGVEGYLPKVYSATCTDSDGGIELFVKGSVVDPLKGTYTDECYTDDNNYPNRGVIEKYCESNNEREKYYNCSGGCKNGACVTPACKFSVGISKTDFTDCIYNEVGCKPAYDLNGDGVYTIIGDVPCYNETATVTCTDSDGGLNYYVKGNAIKEGWDEIQDFCVSSVKLSESICNNDGNPANVQYDCLNGCENGGCRQICELSQCMTNDFMVLDCSDMYSRGVISQHGMDDCKNSWNYVCSRSPSVIGDMNSDNVVNDQDIIILRAIWALGSVFNEQDKKIICADVNGNGRIDDFDLLDLVDILSNKTTTCTDTDGGLDYYVRGNLNLTNSPQIGYNTYSEDFCSGNILREVYCNVSGVVDGVNGYSQIYYSCPNGCEGGVCIASIGCKSPAGINQEDFVNCIYNGEGCEGKYDLNGDGMYTIVGDVPCYNEMVTATCTDSDGGLDYYVKGNTKGSTYLNINEIGTLTDHCYNNTYLNEGGCEEGWTGWYSYNCPNGCKDGACVPEPTGEIVPESSCDGCTLNEKCYSYGHRIKGTYCSDNSEWLDQKSPDKNGDWAMCENNYECTSNFCSSGECLELTTMLKELSGWKVFGTKLICRMGHLLNVENYNGCVGERIGKAYLENK